MHCSDLCHALEEVWAGFFRYSLQLVDFPLVGNHEEEPLKPLGQVRHSAICEDGERSSCAHDPDHHAFACTQMLLAARAADDKPHVQSPTLARGGAARETPQDFNVDGRVRSADSQTDLAVIDG